MSHQDIKWKPDEIIVNRKVKNDPATISFIEKCPGVSVNYVSSALPKDVINASNILKNANPGMLNTILAGKKVVFLTSATNNVDKFEIPDDRLTCPHFYKLKLASNGCYYKCDWCYLKLTYRAAFPYISVYVQYEKIKEQILKLIRSVSIPVMFNAGELADSLSMEHLTGAMRDFIPWFAGVGNGYLFLLTKSDNVDEILELPHNRHSVITWSMNNEVVSRKFEIGAPSFHRRLEAAHKVQRAGYPLRIRIDPIVPFPGWKETYRDTMKIIFERVAPERITLGTLRFEEQFYKIRNSIFSTGPEIPKLMERMKPMFEPKIFGESKRPKIGKYSFTEDERIMIFNSVIQEIRKYSNCPIALCKESNTVWKALGMDSSQCQCVCQYN